MVPMFLFRHTFEIICGTHVALTFFILRHLWIILKIVVSETPNHPANRRFFIRASSSTKHLVSSVTSDMTMSAGWPRRNRHLAIVDYVKQFTLSC